MWGVFMTCEQLSKFFNKYHKKISVKNLLKELGLEYKDMDMLLNLLYELEKKGEVYRDKDNLYMHVPCEFYLKHGVLERSNKNNCYIKTKNGLIIIYNHDLKKAKVGDIVFVEILSKDPRFNRCIGKVDSIVRKMEFSPSYILKAQLKKDYKNDSYYIMVDKKKITIPFKKLNGAYPGDMVSVQVDNNVGNVVSVLSRVQTKHIFECKIENGNITWIPFGTYKFKTKLINCHKKFVNGDKIIANINEDNELEFVGMLDNCNDLLTQIKMIVLDHGVNFEFPDNIEHEIKKLPSIEEELLKRIDLRHLKTFTVDPETAKDLDDALSLEICEDGYKLYVHIADVSFYVRYMTAIYEEAKKRCTSGYFGNIVRSMLPSILSEDLCSLMPDGDKLAKTLVMRLDKEGNILDFEILRTVIKSSCKMTYEKVDDALNGNVLDEYKPFLKELFELSKLSILFENKKRERGYIGFKTEEYNFNIVDDEINMTVSGNGPAHLMVENCMLLANECWTSYLHWLELPVMYRNHEIPDCDKIVGIKNDLKHYHIRTIKNASDPKILQKVLSTIAKSGNDGDVQLASKILLQYMQRAFYSESNLGHYGLALEYYSTFTSPIRRFPDLVNHLILDSFLDGNDIYKSIANDLKEICQTVNEENYKIEQVEKAVNSFLLKNYISRCDEDLNATVKVITKEGIYVRTETGFFGLIPIPSLRYDPATGIASIGNKDYKVNDEISVRMIDVNKDCEIIFRISKEKRKEYEY